MTEVKTSDARNNLGALLSRVERGEEIVVTRRGRLIARLVCIEGVIDQAQAAWQRIRNRATELGLGAFDWEALKADRYGSRP